MEWKVLVDRSESAAVEPMQMRKPNNSIPTLGRLSPVPANRMTAEKF